jgi:purine-binding chemotaxis protein CheW
MQVNPEEFEVSLAVFSLDGQPYAIDIMKIKQIIRPLKINKLPGGPNFLEGVINLRGVVIPVIDMRKRFAMDERESEEEKKVIIASVDRRIVGIIVDEVSEVVPVPRSEVQPPPRVIKGVESNYLMGVCRYKDDILMILNLDEILTAEEKITLKTFGSKKAENSIKKED